VVEDDRSRSKRVAADKKVRGEVTHRHMSGDAGVAGNGAPSQAREDAHGKEAAAAGGAWARQAGAGGVKEAVDVGRGQRQLEASQNRSGNDFSPDGHDVSPRQSVSKYGAVRKKMVLRMKSPEEVAGQQVSNDQGKRGTPAGMHGVEQARRERGGGRDTSDEENYLNLLEEGKDEGCFKTRDVGWKRKRAEADSVWMGEGYDRRVLRKGMAEADSYSSMEETRGFGARGTPQVMISLLGG
jgi:hypothetical protein